MKKNLNHERHEKHETKKGVSHGEHGGHGEIMNHGSHGMTRNEKGVVPKLRFPEFRGSREWEYRLIENVFRVTRGEVLSMTLVQERESSEYSYPVYSSQTKNNGLAGFYSKFLFENAITWTTDGANAGDVNFRQGKFFCTNVCGVLLNEKGYANTFVAELLNTVTRKYVSYVGNPKLMNGVMGSISIPFPSLPEQSRIADCLSSLDALIAAHSQKLEGLKSYKKGLMQQLFPAKGEKVPKLRFPEFRKSGEWVVKELQEISTIIRGASPRPQGDPRYFGGSVPRLMGKDVTRDGKWVSPCTDFLTNEGAELSRFCKKGTLTIICSGDVGVPSFLAIDACIHDGFLALIDIDNTSIDNDFLYYSLTSLQSIFSDSATHGGVFVNLTTAILKSFSISMPSKKEQSRIASFLSSIDNLITAQSQKIESLKIHKKGLMQQLFPAMDGNSSHSGHGDTGLNQ